MPQFTTAAYREAAPPGSIYELGLRKREKVSAGHIPRRLRDERHKKVHDSCLQSCSYEWIWAIVGQGEEIQSAAVTDEGGATDPVATFACRHRQLRLQPPCTPFA
jgi:hypothetical protein